jgi:hypothetical protein
MLDRCPFLSAFEDLSDLERRVRLSLSADFAERVRWCRGDPRLTAWEEGFLTEIAAMIRRSRGRCRLSQPQWDKYWEIDGKVAVPMEDVIDRLA